MNFLGAADFLSEDKEEIDRKFHNNTAPNHRETLTLFYELDELLSSGPDLVVVNSDVKSHADCVCMLLERDFNVLVEKPMAFDFEDAKRMYRAAKRSSGELIISGRSRGSRRLTRPRSSRIPAPSARF